MATSSGAYNFIAQQEGGLSDDGNTNLGILFSTFTDTSNAVLGVPPDRDTFNNLQTSDQQKYIDYFFLKAGLSRVNNQNVANYLADWNWMFPNASARYTAQALNDKFGFTLDIPAAGQSWSSNTGIIDAINQVKDTNLLLNTLLNYRLQQINDHITKHPTAEQYRTNWTQRANDAFTAFGGTPQSGAATTPGGYNDLFPDWVPVSWEILPPSISRGEAWAGIGAAIFLGGAAIYKHRKHKSNG